MEKFKQPLLLVTFILGLGQFSFSQNCEDQLKQIKQNNKDLRALNERLTKSEDDLGINLAKSNSEKEEAENEIEKLKKELKTLQEKYNKDTQKLQKNLTTEKTGRKEDKRTSKKKLDDLKNQIKPLEVKNKRQEAKVAELEKKLKGKAEDVKDLEKEKKKLNQDIKDLEESNRSFSEDKTKLKKEKEAVEAVLTASEQREENLRKELSKKDKALALLTPIRDQIIKDIAQEMEQLLNSSPEEGKLKLNGIEKQFALALSFKNSGGTRELKAKFEAYKTQLVILNAAQLALEDKYEGGKTKQNLAELATVDTPSFTQDKQRLQKLLSGYCSANNKMVQIFTSVHGVGSKDIRTAVLQNSLLGIAFNIDDYPYLKRLAEQKQRDIENNEMPDDISKQTCQQKTSE